MTAERIRMEQDRRRAAQEQSKQQAQAKANEEADDFVATTAVRQPADRPVLGQMTSCDIQHLAALCGSMLCGHQCAVNGTWHLLTTVAESHGFEMLCSAAFCWVAEGKGAYTPCLPHLVPASPLQGHDEHAGDQEIYARSAAALPVFMADACHGIALSQILLSCCCLSAHLERNLRLLH